MGPKDADGMADSVDPDQTAPDLGLHCVQTCAKTYSWSLLIFLLRTITVLSSVVPRSEFTSFLGGHLEFLRAMS